MPSRLIGKAFFVFMDVPLDVTLSLSKGASEGWPTMVRQAHHDIPFYL